MTTPRPRIVFCGVGALGSNAIVAARNLEATFVLVDHDRVESKNCLAQAFVKAAIGKNKADALGAQLFNFWGVKTESFGVRLQEKNVLTLCANAALVVDAFDNAESRRILSRHCRDIGLPLVHAALSGDGTFGLVRWEGGEDGEERFVADEEDAAGAATCEGGQHLPLITVLAASLARAVQDFIEDGARHDAVVSLSGVSTST